MIYIIIIIIIIIIFHMLAPGDLLWFFPPLPLIFPLLLAVPALTVCPSLPPPELLHGPPLTPPLPVPLLVPGTSLASCSSCSSYFFWVLSYPRKHRLRPLVRLAELQGEQSDVTWLCREQVIIPTTDLISSIALHNIDCILYWITLFYGKSFNKVSCLTLLQHVASCKWAFKFYMEGSFLIKRIVIINKRILKYPALTKGIVGFKFERYN